MNECTHWDPQTQNTSKSHNLTCINILAHVKMYLEGILKVRISKTFFLIFKNKIFTIKWKKKITHNVEITLNEISLNFTEIHELRSSKDHRRKHKRGVLNGT